MAKGIRAVKRVTKKELKEDKLVTILLKARTFVEQNQKYIFGVIGAVVAVIILVSLWTQSKAKSQDQAAYELTQALAQGQGSNPAAMADKFTQISKRYSGTQAGDDALFFSAQMLAMDSKLDEAAQAYEEYLRKGNREGLYYPAALAGKAAVLEDLGKSDEAAGLYVKAANYRKDWYAAPVYRLDAGRAYQVAGDSGKATEQFQYVLDHFPMTTFSKEADEQLTRLRGSAAR
jgi:tetratricopeptide (TPR) repeat protein